MSGKYHSKTPTIKGVVTDYRADNERIVEFNGGDDMKGLISFYPDGRGGLVVSVYNCDPRVRVIAANRIGVDL